MSYRSTRACYLKAAVFGDIKVVGTPGILFFWGNLLLISTW